MAHILLSSGQHVCLQWKLAMFISNYPNKFPAQLGGAVEYTDCISAEG